MSGINLPESAGRVDTFARVEGADTVHMQAVVPVDPADGTPLDLASEATLSALSAAVGTLNAAAAAIQAAVEAINGKTSTVDTSAIDGTVAVNNFPAAISGVAQDATVQAINALNDTMLYMLSAMLEKMPSLTLGDRMRVAVTMGETNYELSSAYGGINTATVGDAWGGRLFSRMLEPQNFADAGSTRLYNQIQVS